MVASIVKPTISVSIEWGQTTSLVFFSGTVLDNSFTISRYFARLAPMYEIYGKNSLERTEVNTIMFVTMILISDLSFKCFLIIDVTIYKLTNTKCN